MRKDIVITNRVLFQFFLINWDGNDLKSIQQVLRALSIVQTLLLQIRKENMHFNCELGSEVRMDANINELNISSL